MSEQPTTFDVLIIGAGITGMHQLVLLRKLGLSVRVLEAGGGVGGTWYWNRYPGARLDSESYSYQYAFDEELLQEWDWSELFAGQQELERYLNRVADKHDLRRDIEFNTRVETMVFDENADQWAVHTEDGRLYRAQFVITATGILSEPNFPKTPGLETFRGEWYHTGLWPQDGVDFTGKRVAVIGTGASGVQVIPQIAPTSAHLTVFQRTPNWAVPLRNRTLSEQEMTTIRADYPSLFPWLRNTFSGFLHSWDPVASTEVSEQERNERFEKAWNSPGFAKWMGLYHDIASDADANSVYCDFLADKIRQRVDDQDIAEKLIPVDHYFGTKRVPCETNYYETYNLDTVDLVLLKDNPIERFIPSGIRTHDGDLEVDMIVLATGFDAFTGALNKIDIRGTGGQTLRDKWKDGPQTYLGLQVAGFPNLFIVGGPHGKGGHGNSPRCSEDVIEWMAGFIQDITDRSLRRVEADPDAERAWTEHVNDAASKTLMSTAKSAFYGDNVDGKAHAYLAYTGTLPDFINRLHDVAQHDYQGFVLHG